MSLLACLILIIFGVVSPASAYRLAVGSYSVTGSPSDDRVITIDPPFAPISVLVKCTANQNTAWAIAAMGADNSVTIGGSTTGAADLIQSFTSSGFVVGLSANVQTASVTCYYAAFGDNGRNDIAVGSYAGSGSDDTDIVISPAFTPNFVMVKNYSGTAANGTFSTTQQGASSSGLNITGLSSAKIKSLNSNGFRVGTNVSANGASRNYAYMAVKLVAGYNEDILYAGTTDDNREIATINTPVFAFIKGDSGTVNTGARFGMSGDLATGIGVTTPTTNIIQNFSATGMQVGTNSLANENTINMYGWVSKDPHYRSKVQGIR